MKNQKYCIIAISIATLFAIFIKCGKDFNEIDQNENNITKFIERERIRQNESTRNSSRDHASHGNIPTITLIAIESDSTPEARSPQWPFPSIRSKRFTSPSGEKVELKIEDDFSILGIDPDPSNTRFLANHGSKGYIIYDLEGKSIHTLPMVAQALPELARLGLFQWNWVNGEKLVAVMELYEERDPSIPRYPDSDPRPFDVRLYSYDLDTKEIQQLKVPSFGNDGLLRFDGVSDEGFLIISQAPHGENYWNTQQDKFLGAYQIPE